MANVTSSLQANVTSLHTDGALSDPESDDFQDPELVTSGVDDEDLDGTVVSGCGTDSALAEHHVASWEGQRCIRTPEGGVVFPREQIEGQEGGKDGATACISKEELQQNGLVNGSVEGAVCEDSAVRQDRMRTMMGGMAKMAAECPAAAKVVAGAERDVIELETDRCRRQGAAVLDSEKQSQMKLLESLEMEKKARANAFAEVRAERKAREKMLLELETEKREREKIVRELEKQRRMMENVQSDLEEEEKAKRELAEELEVERRKRREADMEQDTMKNIRDKVVEELEKERNALLRKVEVQLEAEKKAMGKIAEDLHAEKRLREKLTSELDGEKKVRQRLMSELEGERKLREKVEAGKKDIEITCGRLKEMLHEALRQRDEARRQREDILKQRDEAMKQRDELVKVRDGVKAEVEAGMEAFGGKEMERLVGRAAAQAIIENGELKRGRGGVAIEGMLGLMVGYRRRVDGLVEEVVKQRDAAVKAQDRAREQIDQRNIEIAIEVSDLEAKVLQLMEEVEQKTAEVEKLRQVLVVNEEMEKRGKEMEVALSAEKRRADSLEGEKEQVDKELAEQRQVVTELKRNLMDLDAWVKEVQEEARRTEEGLKKEREEAERGRDAAMEEGRRLTERVAEVMMEAEEVKRQLEHDRIESRTSLEEERAGRRKEVAELEGELRALQEGGERGMEELERQLQRVREELRETEGALRQEKGRAIEAELRRDEAVAEAQALHEEIGKLTSHVAELEKDRTITRSEMDDLQSLVHEGRDLMELEKVSRMEAEERVLSLTLELERARQRLSEAEDEVNKWSQAAKEEAMVGGAVLKESEGKSKQIASLTTQLAQWRKMAEELSAKIRSKEEIVAAATAARDAAEQSLQVADDRARQLRARVEALETQLEEVGRWGGGGSGAGILSRLSWGDCWPRRGWNTGGSVTEEGEMGSSRTGGGLAWLFNRAGRRGGTRSFSQAEMEELMQPLV
ncbi:hypothetical protein CBR_g72679 [Chara braunii]|uniref:Uncharacterized protein n=1 Tax=Chara braunii TaxID=69332 RepID=A0A388KA22_CHABU|nr:hypothetical protein CBR_g72679 [Chara braunii]|eukprot:GBG66924.1 hypothetical protein CBR_g72679 [Chara braunii]